MTNLIQNGTFDTIPPWILYTAGGTGTATAENGEAKIDVISIGTGNYSWQYQFYQNGLILEPNAKYKINFDIHTDNSSKAIEFYIHDDSIYPPNLFSADINVTTSKTTYEYFLDTYSIVPSNIRIRFKFLTIGIYYIDNVILEKVIAVPNTGSLDIKSSPSRARIYIDNIDTLAITPNIILNVPIGERELLLTKEGYNDYTDVVTINADQTTITPTYILLEDGTNGTLNIKSNPNGARIYIDNIDTLAMTPIILSLTPGEHQIILILNNYNQLTDVVNIITGQQTTKEYSLTKYSLTKTESEFPITSLIIPTAIVIGVLILLYRSNKK